MPLIQLTAPPREPLSLAEAKQHLRVDDAFTADDSLIQAQITACREYAEHLCQCKFVSQQWRLVLDSFPGPQYTRQYPFGKAYGLPEQAILIPKAPVLSIDSINYLDMGNVWRTMPETDYVADIAGYPARITPVFGKIWPIPMPQIGSIHVDFHVGFGDSVMVPEGVKAWIKCRLDTLYNFRGENAVTRTGKVNSLPHVDRMLDPYRLVVY